MTMINFKDMTPEQYLEYTAQNVTSISGLIDTDGRSIVLNHQGPVYEELSDEGKGFIYSQKGLGTRSFWPIEKGDLGAAVEAYQAKEAERLAEIQANKGWLEKAKDKLNDFMEFGS